jgi:two-component system phosphate regulon sensor histidine kinase PhoR
LSIAINRALLYSEVQQFNETLQEKVERATKELQQRYRELKQIRAKERDMMDIMGHELRTPLSIIKITLGALDMKVKKDPSEFGAETYKEYRPRLYEALDREIKLLETMLTSTKIDASRVELNLEDVNLTRVIEDAILSQKEKAEEKGLEIEAVDIPGDLHVYADKVRIAEVIDNFVSNAVKYTQEGHVEIHAEVVDKMVRVCVEDTGPGIPEEAMPRLGEKFFRVGQYINNGKDGENQADKDSKKTRKEKLNDIVRPGGTGLGLYVSFNLIKLMGGKVTVDSEVGKGSTFCFTVPKYTDQQKKNKTSKDKNLFARLNLDKEALEKEEKLDLEPKKENSA